MPDPRLPAAPPSVRYHDLPIATFAGWDKVAQVEGVLTQHDYGQLRSSAMFADSLMRDDRINAVVETRIGSLMAAPIQCTPADDSAAAAKYAEEVGGTDTRPGLWTQMFPQSVMSGLAFWGLMIGIGIAEIVWKTDDEMRAPAPPTGDPRKWVQIPSAPGYAYTNQGPAGRPRARGVRTARWTPRLKLWHPQFVYWDWATYRWMLICHEGVVPLPNTDESPHSDGKWVIYTPRGYQYGWLRSLLRPLAYKWLMRGWNYRDWARYNERHGQPIIGAKTPKDADEDVADEFVDSVRAGAADGVVELPQGEVQGESGYGIEIIEARSRSFDSFDLFKKALDVDTAIVVLGQNLTTEGGGQQGGSRALGQIQNQVRLDKRREDAELAQVVQDQVLYWDAEFNYGDGALAARSAYQVDPPEDETEEGQALLALGQGLDAVAAVSKGRLDVITILEEHGLPLLTEEEVAAQKASELEDMVARQQALGPPDPEPVGGGDGGDGGPPNGGAGAARGGPPEKKALRAGEGSLPSTVVSRRTFQGLSVAIENPAGSLRVWKDGENSGTTKMLYDYGFLDGVAGADGEELDVYLGPDENAPNAHVVHQLRAPWGQRDYDEDKTFLGFSDAGAAEAAFLAHRNDGKRAFGSMSTIPLDAFKRKLRAREGSGKIRATALAETRADARRQVVEALEALARRAPTPVALRAFKGRGAARSKRWPDRLEQAGVKAATRALAPDLAGMLAEVNEAKDFDDLKARIVKRYKARMSPTALAEIVRKTNLLAHLGGRLTAIKQI